MTAKTFTISNTGAQPVTITSITFNTPSGIIHTADLSQLNGSSSFSGTQATISKLLAAGATATFSVDHSYGNTTIGTKNGTIVITGTNGVSAQIATTINVTNTTATYALTSNINSITEGGSVIYTISTTNVPNGTVVYWASDFGLTPSYNTVTGSDFGIADDLPLSGTAAATAVTINNNTGTFTLTAVADSLTEGTETLALTIRSSVPNGPLLARGPIVTVADSGVANTAPRAIGVFPTATAPAGTSGINYSFAQNFVDDQNNINFYSVLNAPPGLTMNSTTGALSGTVTTPGTYNTTVTARDAGGLTAQISGTLTVTAAPVTNTAPRAIGVFPTASAPAGTSGINYSFAQNFVDDQNNINFYSVLNAPPGLTMNSTTGVMSGTVTTPGTYNTTVTATDSGGLTAQISGTLTVTAAAAPVVQATSNGAVVATMTSAAPNAAPFTITQGQTAGWNMTGGVPNGTLRWYINNTPQSDITLSATGTFSASNTVVDTVGSVFTVRLEFMNSANTAVAQTYTVTQSVIAAPVTNTAPRAIGVFPTASAPAGTSGINYSFAQNFTDDQNNINFYSAQNAPPGLTMNSTTGVMSGTVTTPGTYNTTVTATDSGGLTAQISGTLTVTAANTAPRVTGAWPNPQTQVWATPFNEFNTLFSDTEGNITSYSATGLPPGLTMNSTTGVMSGQAIQEGMFNVSVTATDAGGLTATISGIWQIYSTGDTGGDGDGVSGDGPGDGDAGGGGGDAGDAF